MSIIDYIGILAAITIVAYNGIRGRTNVAAVQSNLNAIAKKLEIYNVDNGSYPNGATAADVRDALSTINIHLSTGSYSTAATGGTNNSNLLYLVDNNGTAYALLAAPKSGATLYISNASGGMQSYTVTGGAAFPTSSSATIATNLGMNGTTAVAYYIYVHSAGDFRIWT